MIPQSGPALASPKSVPERVAELVGDFLNYFSITTVFATHFLLVVCILLMESDYPGEVIKPYIVFYNVFFFLSLFWSVHESTKTEPLHFAVAINLASILCDIIVAGRIYDHRIWFIFTSCLLRPVTSLILIRQSYERKRKLTSLPSKISIDRQQMWKYLMAEQEIILTQPCIITGSPAKKEVPNLNATTLQQEQPSSINIDKDMINSNQSGKGATVVDLTDDK